ncbi:MAG: CsgG/HfaB family protein, partial [Spirochaetia bacterium]
LLLCSVSCAGTPEGHAGSAEIEERVWVVVEEWKEAVRTQDIDGYMELFREDAVKLNGEPNGVLTILRGAPGIREEMAGVFEDLGDFLSQHEYPPGEYSFDEVTGSSQFLFNLENPHFKEALRFEEREGKIRISEHWVFGRFFNDLETGELTAWADGEGNGDGLLQPDEQERLFIAAYRVLFEQHDVESPMDEFFDWDNNGSIDELDNEIAQQVLLRNRFRGIDKFDEELARHRIPPAEETVVEIHRANWLKHAVVHPEWELPFGPVEWDHPKMADFNEDDLICPLEVEFFRDLMIRVAAVNPEPVLYDKEMPAFVSEIRRWADSDRNEKLSDMESTDGGYEFFETIQGKHGLPAWTPVSRFFDRNRDGVVEPLEKEWAMDYVVDFLIPSSIDVQPSVWNWAEDRHYNFLFDLDGQPELREEEKEEVRRFVMSFEELFWQDEDPDTTELRWVDVDGDGEVEMWEADLYRDMLFQALFKTWLGLPEEEANSLRVRSALDEAADADGDGMLSTEEREELIRGLAHPHEVRTAFDYEIDFDGNGEVSMDEIFRARDTGYISAGEPSAERRIASLGTDSAGRTAAGSSEKGVSGERFSGKRSKVKAIAMRGSTLAVIGVQDMTGKMAEGQTNLLVSFLENAFVNFGNATVVDRQNIERIMEEYTYQSSGLVDEDTAVEIGKLSGADAIAMGSVSRLGETYYLHLKVINVQSGAIVGSSISEGSAEKDFLGMCNGAVEPLF